MLAKSMAALTLVASASAMAQSPWQFNLYGVLGSEGDLQRGGTLSEQQVGAKIAYTQPMAQGRLMGVSLSMDVADYNVKNATITGLDDLDQRQQYQLSGFMMQPLSREWSLVVSPSLNWSYADGASFSDGFGWGLLGMANYRASNTLRWGFALSYTNDVYDNQFAPFITVDWQINDQWRLSNPFEAGFNGRAGLELSYKANTNLEFGLGGGYRQEEFAFKDGAVKQELPMGFVRMTYKIRPGLNWNFIAGYRTEGELKWRENGRTNKTDVDGRGLLAVLVNF
ncbi:MAG: DUF6268 family outer membrane beta-barrel protein [Ferrimonas sp.]